MFMLEQQFTAINQQCKEIIFDNCRNIAGNCCSQKQVVQRCQYFKDLMSSGDYFLLTLQRYNISEGHCPFQSVSVLKGLHLAEYVR